MPRMTLQNLYCLPLLRCIWEWELPRRKRLWRATWEIQALRLCLQKLGTSYSSKFSASRGSSHGLLGYWARL
jgi:hypothetical protein